MRSRSRPAWSTPQGRPRCVASARVPPYTRPLVARPLLRPLRPLRGGSGEAHFPTQQPQAQEDARVPRADAHQGRSRRAPVPASSRPCPPLGLIRRIPDRGTFSALAEAPKFRAGSIVARYLAGPELRVGFSISKRVGGAVARNRVRRRLRAAFAQAELPTGDYLLSAEAAAGRASFETLTAALADIGRQVGR